mgnify:CR=1 FL=1
MKTLVKKDIKVVGLLINFILIPLGLMLVLFLKMVDDNFLRYSFYIGILILMIGMVHIQLWAHDFHFKSDRFLNSLPLDKELIVSSRYVTMLVYVLYSALIVYVFSYISTDRILIYPIKVSEILTISSIVIILMAFYLPFYYLIGHKDGRTNDLYLFIMTITVIILRNSYKKQNILYSSFSIIDLKQFSLLLIIISLIAYMVSLYSSIKIYRDREF